MPNPPLPRLSDVPGLAGPSLTGTITFRNLMQLGYGLNVLIAGGGSVEFLVGIPGSKVWASIVVLAAVATVAGQYITERTDDTHVEMWATIALFATFVGQCTAVVLCTLYQLGPNGMLPFWWPAALGVTALWRVRNIVRVERAKEAARLR